MSPDPRDNLIDKAQPVLYYGLLTSKTNLDTTAAPLLKALRAKLGVEPVRAPLVHDWDTRRSGILSKIFRLSVTRRRLLHLFKGGKLQFAMAQKAGK